MNFVKAGKEDVKTLEDKIDEQLSLTPLPSKNLHASRYHLVTASEDMLRIALLGAHERGGDALMMVMAMFDDQKYALKQALAIVGGRQSHELHGACSFELEDCRRALELLDFAGKYEAAVTAFSSYYAGRAECLVRRHPPALKFLPRKNSDRYDVLDMLDGDGYRGQAPLTPVVRWFQGPAVWPQCVWEIIKSVSRASPLNVAYEYREDLSGQLHGEIPFGLSVLPVRWSSKWGGALEVSRILHAIQVICAYHVVAVTLGARSLEVRSLAVENVALCVSMDTLRDRVCVLSGCPFEQVERILGLLVYGVGTRTPDPFLQPLIPIGSERVVLSPLNLISAHVQRNFLVLMARADAKSFDAVSHCFETEMVEKVGTCLMAGQRIFKAQIYIPGAREAGEVDLVVIDPGACMVLVCELKWTIPVAETRELLGRERGAGEKVLQVQRKVDAARAQLPALLREFGLNTADVRKWRVEGVVVIEGFAAEGTQSVPVVTRRTFERGLKIKKSLKSAFHWFKSDHWLPKRNEHFERITQSVEINGVQLGLPGLMPTVDGVRLVQAND